MMQKIYAAFEKFIHINQTGENKMTDEEVNKNPSAAIAYYADKLTPEQFDFCVRERPAAALEYCSERLTKEQLDYCVHKCPATALLLCAEKQLTKEQIDYCKEKTK